MEINKHISGLQPSATLVINEKVKALRKQGKTISHFGFGQSPFPIHPSIVMALQQNANNNKYLPVAGLDILRAQIAQFLKNFQGIETEKEAVFIGPGSKELLYQSILIFDAEFLIPKASWVSYLPQIQSKGAKYHIIDTQLQNNFKVTAADIHLFFKDNKTQKSPVLILNSPNNPTGAIYSDEECKSLATVCKQYDITVFSDEIYSQIHFSENFSPSMAAYYPEKTIVFGGLSKVFSAGGYRLGFMVLPHGYKELTNVYKSLFSETFSCVASPVQYAAVKAYSYQKELQDYVRNTSEILQQVANYMLAQFKSIGLDCTQPEGAFYMMIGFNSFKKGLHKLGLSTSSELANFLLENYQFAMLPGSDFGFDKKDLFFRIAFVDFDGKKVLDAYLKETHIDAVFIEKYAKNISEGIKSVQKFVLRL